MLRKISLLSILFIQGCFANFPHYDEYALMRFEFFNKIISDLYLPIDDARISPEDKALIEKLGPSSSVYGEIFPGQPNQFPGLNVIFEYLTKKGLMGPNAKFVDLGSGMGKVVFQAYLTTQCSSALGIEYAKDRYDKAIKILAKAPKISDACIKFENDTRNALGMEKLPKVKKTIKFIHSSFLDVDLSQITVAYTCSTLFALELLKDLMDKIAKECKDGFHLISLGAKGNKKLPEHKDFHLIKTFYLPMTWTPNDHVYVYVMDKKGKPAVEEDYAPFATMTEDDELSLNKRKFVETTKEEESETETSK